MRAWIQVCDRSTTAVYLDRSRARLALHVTAPVVLAVAPELDFDRPARVATSAAH